MTDHLVDVFPSSRGVHLRCQDCDFYADIGHRNHMDYPAYAKIAPVATVVKWSHLDPSLIEPMDGDSSERSFLKRVSDYLIKGVAP